MNPFVAAIWSLALLGTVIGFVPNAISWLIRTLAAAKHIEKYSEEILTSGVGIAQNTANVRALKDTLAAAPSLVAGAESIGSRLTSIHAALAPGSTEGPRTPEKGDQP